MNIEEIPEHLKERFRTINGNTAPRPRSSKKFVLYWMCTAVRTDENPALDVARLLADREELPLLIYQAISDQYKYASDRHHRFMLEGAKDVQRQFAELDLSYAFHLVTGKDRRPHLATLAEMSSIVVTEEMPVGPQQRFLQTLAKRVNTPIACVDTACVAPMQLVSKPFTRAFEFRNATKSIYAERLTREWPTLNVTNKAYDLSELPFETTDLQNANLSGLIAECEIDHSIGPVFDTVGGSKSGYQRWAEFKTNRIQNYAKHRNDPLKNGVSRMSAYLHFGMVSPLRLARESSMIRNEGAEKFLDELLIWRELAYSFCFHRKDCGEWSAIPKWAQEALKSHTPDPRPHIYCWEQLARGKTEDVLWNAAQKSLLVHGELHNNVRMTWGKALLNWTRTPEEALKLIIDLNHRYALDGRDPASYGGILWCFGQFDRPFVPENQIIGSVRPRPTSVHAQRMNLTAYEKITSTPRYHPVPKIAVVGAGLSGLLAARTLKDHGVDVTVFEKSLGVGGRMSTRWVNEGSFDHGAQYFTARDPRFRRYVASWMEQGIVDRWPKPKLGAGQRIVVIENGTIKSQSDSQERFVAVPTMNAICKHLAQDLDIQTNTRIEKLDRSEEGIELADDSNSSLGVFDRLILSVPSPQATELVSSIRSLADPISQIKMNPCWAALATFEKPVTDDWVGAFLHGSFLSWTARNSAKPGRNRKFENVIIHASPDWTAENLEQDAEQVAERMLNEFWRVTGAKKQPTIYLQAHRWRFAIPVAPINSNSLIDSSERIVCCGDWANGSRVEGAFLSGMSAAGRILGSIRVGSNEIA